MDMGHRKLAIGVLLGSAVLILAGMASWIIASSPDDSGSTRLAGPSGPTPWFVDRAREFGVDCFVYDNGASPIHQLPEMAHNQTEPRGCFVTFRLEGTRSNRDGVGARVTIEAGGRRRVSERIGSGSYASAADPRLHFGLGSSQTVGSVEVRWPSGRVDRHDEHLAADRGYLLREGEVRARPLAGFPAAASGDSSSPMRRSKR